MSHAHRPAECGRRTGTQRAAACAGLVLSFLLMTLLPADLSPQEPTQAKPGAAETMRPEIVGTHGIVAGGRHLSVAVAIRVLQAGGADVRRKRYAFGW